MSGAGLEYPVSVHARQLASIALPLALAGCALDRAALSGAQDPGGDAALFDAALFDAAGLDAAGVDAALRDGDVSPGDAGQDAARMDAAAPDVGPPDAGRFETHIVECESGTLVGGMMRGADSDASGGAYAHAPGGANWTADGASLPPSRVELPLTLGRPGPWFLHVRIYTLNGGADATYAGFVASDLRRFYRTDFRTWVWAPVERFDLGPGAHTLVIGPGEPGPRCDRLVFTTDPDLDPAE